MVRGVAEGEGALFRAVEGLAGDGGVHAASADTRATRSVPIPNIRGVIVSLPFAMKGRLGREILGSPERWLRHSSGNPSVV
ncbi:hypothetical protein GCM10009800_49480 [Nocardiopsis rhodophaea]